MQHLKAVRRKPFTALAAALVALTGSLAVGTTAHATSQHAKSPHPASRHTKSSVVAVHRVGTFSYARYARTSPGASELSPATADDPGHATKNPRLRHTYAASQPNVSPTAITSGPSVPGFPALNHLQQRYAGTKTDFQNTQFSTIPSDQGLCVSSGLSTNYVLEAVNTAVRVYGTDGSVQSGVIPLNAVFGQDPEVLRQDPPVYGPSLGDPECYFDVPTQRWFMSVYKFSVDPDTGDVEAPTSALLAVSSGSDPTTSTWTTYSVDTTDAGNPNCPCFGDHPNLGADANGVYIADDEFGITTDYFKSSQIFAFSKSGIESGTITSAVQLDSADASGWPGGAPFELWPAQSPSAADFETGAGGTEYMLATMDLTGALELGVRSNEIGVWALTNTSSLDTDTPDLGLSFVSVPTGTYTQEPNAVQKKGPYPLGQGAYDSLLGVHVHGGEELLETDQDEMNQVYYADGTLWGSTNTGVKEPTGATLSGIEWFAFDPSVANGLSATLSGQNYLAADGQYLAYPSIAATSGGDARMVFTLVGPDYYPSLGWTTVNADGSQGTIHVLQQGTAPADTFGGYEVFKYQPGLSRWGDYTAAVADSSGTIWVAGGWISGNKRCDPPGGDLTLCPGDADRSLLANWGTWIAAIPTS